MSDLWILDTDLRRIDSVILCSSLQSCMVPFCFSTTMLAPEKSEVSFPASEIAVWRLWSRKLRMLGEMLTDIESFRESRQASGCGVALQKV